jgi:hypothetical protein|mmetsp:Transcript_19319/g.30982  ORF Transcript_19319/g.30982 Transcript_19319/m.30982 type:complete len:214 (-) Transcript_19319:31-672(-)
MIAVLFLASLGSASSASLRTGAVAPPCAKTAKTACSGTWYHGTKVEQMCFDHGQSFPPTDGYFIQFYHPSCQCSKQFVPTWTEFAGETMNRVGAVDCSLHVTTCKHFGIMGYPTMIAYHNNLWYNGPKGAPEMAELKKWARQIIDGMVGGMRYEAGDFGNRLAAKTTNPYSVAKSFMQVTDVPGNTSDDTIGFVNLTSNAWSEAAPVGCWCGK